MVNKEFIIGNGNIAKDFSDRNIPQFSHNQVMVYCSIPVSLFADYENYAVELAVALKVGGNTTPLPALSMVLAKTFKLDGVDYVKYGAKLSHNYTKDLGELLLTPYIQEIHTEIVDEGEETEETINHIILQDTSTYVKLNVIRSIVNTETAEFDGDGTEISSALLEMIYGKRIKFITDYANSTLAELYFGIAENYAPTSLLSYEGYMFMVKHTNGNFALFPYMNSSAVEFTKLDLKDGTLSKIYNIGSTTNNDETTYSYDSLKLTYNKSDIDTNFYTKLETYTQAETDALLDTKVNKTFTISGHALSGDSLQLVKGDVGLGNVENYDTINSPTQNAYTSWVTAGGLYTYLITNFADKSDYDTTKAKVEELYTSFKGTGDNDNVVNTLYDLIQVFQNFPEADNIATILSGLDSRIDTLEELSDALITINQSITILTTDWESNSGDYSSDYPYKTKANVIKNDLLKGAEAFEIVFSVDSDTSLLSTTAILDNTTGNITLYASETPSEDIVINKINAVNGLNAINTLTTDTINQVQQNKNDISDIKSNKLDKKTTLNGKQAEISRSIGADNISQTMRVDSAYRKYCEVSVGYADANDKPSFSIIMNDDDEHNGIQYLTFDGDLKVNNKNVNMERLFTSSTDATESGGIYTLDVSGITGIEVNDYILYVNSGVATTLYQVASITSGTATLNVIASFGGGGGSQLYQHNIKMYKYEKWTITLSLITDNNTQFTASTLFNWLANNGFTTSEKVLACNGVAWYGSTLYNIMGIGQTTANDNSTAKHLIGRADASWLNYYEALDLTSATITDTIITL